MTINVNTIEKLRGYKMNLTPVKEDKSPVRKNGKWFKDWTNQELLNAKRIGVWHKESEVFDVDFDDKSFNAHKFIDMLPPTFTIGKMVNGKPVATHKIYRHPKDVEPKYYSYPTKAAKDKKIIELLTNKMTWIAGDRIIINDVDPLETDPSPIRQTCQLIVAFSELLVHWPEANKGLRDDAFMRLTGALARETDIPVNVQEQFIEKLCMLTGDREISNRVNKVQYQHDQFAAGEDVYGMKELSTYLGVNLPGFDEIKRKEEKDKTRKIIYSNSLEFSQQQFPVPKNIVEPIVRDQTVIAITGEPGTGKTLLGLKLAAAASQGGGFLGMPTLMQNRIPVLYVEGELPGDDLKTRINSMRMNLAEQGVKWNDDYFNIASLQQQLEAGRYGFEPMQTEQGLLEIENAIEEISERTGKKVFIHLDNISMLCPGFKENDADAWSPLMTRFMAWKNKGHTIVYYHHLNKSGSSSGSTMQTRAIDMSIRLTKPDSKHKIKMKGDKAMQAVMDFPKWRLHDNSKHAQQCILTCTDRNEWHKYPMLDDKEMAIINFYNDGYTVKEMVDELELKESTIYRKLKRLKEMEVIKDDKVIGGKTINRNAEEIRKT